MASISIVTIAQIGAVDCLGRMQFDRWRPRGGGSGAAGGAMVTERDGMTLAKMPAETGGGASGAPFFMSMQAPEMIDDSAKRQECKRQE
jgi:hypothetical protein